MPNPTLISATKNNAAIAAANTSVTVTSTGNVTAGNLQIVAIEIAGAIAPSGITAPVGWTTLLGTTVTEASGLVSAAIFYKQATATGAFSGSFSWTTASTGGEWLFMEWSGCGAAFVDGASVTTLNASSTSPVSPSISPGAGKVNDTLVCVLFGGVLSASTVAIPGGMSSILTVNGSASQTLFGAASLNLASSAATSSKTWTLGTAMATLGVSFLLQQALPWGWEPVSIPPPQTALQRTRGAAIKGKSEFAGFSFFRAGWEVAPIYQRARLLRLSIENPTPIIPPKVLFSFIWDRPDDTWKHPRPEQGSSIIDGDDGDEAPFQRYFVQGWEIASPQPPHPRPEKAGAIMEGEDGDEAIFSVWRNAGWEVQPPQPPHPRPERAAAITPWINVDSPFIVVASWGWEIGDRAANRVPVRTGALLSWLNIELPPAALSWGWDSLPAAGRLWRLRAPPDLGEDGPPAIIFQAAGWEIAPVQPSHPRPERGAPLIRGEDGSESPLVVLFAQGWENIPPQPPHPRPERSAAIAPLVFIDGTLVAFFPAGWESQPEIAPRSKPRPLDLAGLETEAPFPVIAWGWQAPDSSGRRRLGFQLPSAFLEPLPPVAPLWTPDLAEQLQRRPAGLQDGIPDVFPFFPPPTPIIWAFDLAGIDLSPRHLGTDAASESELVSFSFLPAGWEIQPPQPPLYPRLGRPGAIMAGDDGIENIFTLAPFAEGWQIQPPQPPVYPKPGPAAIMRGLDGTDAIFVVPFPEGWAIQPPPPPHPRPEKAGAVVPPDVIEQLFLPLIALLPGWEPILPPNRWIPRSWAGGDDGIQAQFFAALLRFDLSVQQPELRRRITAALDAPPLAFLAFPPPISGWDGAPEALRRRHLLALEPLADVIQGAPPPPDAATWALDLGSLARTRRVDSRFSAALELFSSVVPVPPAAFWGYEAPLGLGRRRFIPLDFQAALIVPPPAIIWTDQQPGHLVSRPRRTIIRQDQDRAVIIIPPPLIWGFDGRPELTQARRPRIDSPFELISSFPAIWTSGWEASWPQPPQPPRDRLQGIALGDERALSQVIIPAFFQWDVVSLTPPHPLWARAAATMEGDISAGPWAPFFSLIPFGAVAHDFAVWGAIVYDIGRAPP